MYVAHQWQVEYRSALVWPFDLFSPDTNLSFLNLKSVYFIMWNSPGYVTLLKGNMKPGRMQKKWVCNHNDWINESQNWNPEFHNDNNDW